MRSRYSAFVLGKVDYLFHTLHPSHDDYPRGPEALATSVQRHARSIRYLGLRILDDSPPDEEGVAQVLFLAKLRQRGRPASFVELSSFAKEKGEWRYMMGTPLPSRGLDPEALSISAFQQILD